MEPEQIDGPGFNPMHISDKYGLIAKKEFERIGRAKSTSFASLRVPIQRSAKIKATKAIYLAVCIMCAVDILLTLTFMAQASPLSETSFDQFASQCAPGVKVSTLWAVASVESQFEPLALRDNNSRQAWKMQSLSAAVNLAQRRLEMGHSVDLGLMQINSRNLRPLGMNLSEAFDACDSLGAASRILLADMAVGNTEAEREAALLIVLSRYNTGKALSGIANGYSLNVIAARSKALGDQRPVQNPINLAPQWDIWGNSSSALAVGIVTTANKSSEIERAGAQSSDARNEGRAPASQSEKGEPYELSAYQESDPGKP